MTSKIGIVIPCFNGARFLQEAVESVLRQTETNWQLLIVDDGSTDDSLVVARNLAARDRRISVESQANAGVSSARNLGADRLSPTEYLLFLDADDVCDSTMLARLAGYLDAHPKVGTVYCRYRPIDASGKEISDKPTFTRYRPGLFGLPRRIPENDPATPFEAVMAWMMVIPSTALIRTSAYRNVGKWDTSFTHDEDNDMFLRLALAAEIHFINETLTSYRQHADAQSAQQRLAAMGRRMLESKWRSNRDLDRAGQKRAMKAIGFEKKVTAMHQIRGAATHIRNRRIRAAILGSMRAGAATLRSFRYG